MLEEIQELTLILDENFIKFLRQEADIKTYSDRQELYINNKMYKIDYTTGRFTVKNSDYWMRKSDTTN